MDDESRKTALEEAEALAIQAEEDRSNAAKIEKARRALESFAQNRQGNRLALGAELARTFFNDSKEEYDRGCRKKNHPFNAFCRDGFLQAIGVDKKTIQNAIRMHFQWDSYPQGKRELVPPSIHVLLLSVEDDESRIKLFNEAVEKQPTYDEMEKHVRKYNAEKKSTRKPILPVKKCTSFLGHAQKELEAILTTGSDKGRPGTDPAEIGDHAGPDSNYG